MKASSDGRQSVAYVQGSTFAVRVILQVISRFCAFVYTGMKYTSVGRGIARSLYNVCGNTQ